MNRDGNPFHEGELLAQSRAGEAVAAARNAAVLKTAVPAGALSFIGRQYFAVLALEDRGGAPSVFLLFGPPGFIMAPEPTALVLRADVVTAAGAGDLRGLLPAGARFGLLFIDLSARRRLRVNGAVESATPGGGIRLRVEEAYPNCPKYIWSRDLDRPDAGRVVEPPRACLPLGRETEAALAGIDTVFLATTHAGSGLDASHRGGPKGFLQVTGPSTLRMPDYPGNSMFNTHGNLLCDSRIAALAVDWDRGVALEFRGRGFVETAAPEKKEDRTGGTGRSLRIEVETVASRRLPGHFAWTPGESPPELPQGCDSWC